MKEESSEYSNLEFTETMSLVLCYLTLVNLQKLTLSFFEPRSRILLKCLAPQTKKTGFYEGYLAQCWVKSLRK